MTCLSHIATAHVEQHQLLGDDPGVGHVTSNHQDQVFSSPVHCRWFGFSVVNDMPEQQATAVERASSRCPCRPRVCCCTRRRTSSTVEQLRHTKYKAPRGVSTVRTHVCTKVQISFAGRRESRHRRTCRGIFRRDNTSGRWHVHVPEGRFPPVGVEDHDGSISGG